MPNGFAVSTIVGNLDINIENHRRIEVYKGDKHIFSEDCSDFTCKVFTSNVENPKIKTEDGAILISKDIHKLSIENIEPFKPFYWLDHNFIKFVVSTSSVSGSYRKQEEYLVDTTTGAIRIDTQSSDWFKYGLTKE